MQTLLPIVPADGLIINRVLSVVKRTEGEKTIWAYFYGAGLVLKHESDDLRSFKMYTSQLICSVANPRAKGKVENPFYYLEQHFLKGNSFRDFADFSSRLSDFNMQVNARIHTTTRLAPEQMHAEEQKQQCRRR